jgi:replication factor C subunit 1
MGQNSKTTKNYRQLNDIQIHMRLRTSANQAQIRQHYVPALAAHMVDPLTTGGAVCCATSLVLGAWP